MATAQLDSLLRCVHKLAAGRGSLQRTDHQLVDDFSARHDEAAFAALVARHGPMVLRVCRRVLHHEQDAEDAFQATFLILARKTASIRKREAIGEWLHGVAYRTALEVQRRAARRRGHEARLWTLMRQAAVSPAWDDVQAVLDEEIQRLPESFRAAFVLCVLEGKSGPEVAAELGVKEGTVSSRLTRARQLLQKRLIRRGIKLSALLAALSIAEGAGKGAVPAALTDVTIRFGLVVAAGEPAAGVIPTHIAALAAGGTQAMFLTKAKIVTAIVLAVGLLTASAGARTYRGIAANGADQPPASDAKKLSKTPGEAAKPTPPAERKTGEQFTYKGRVLGPDGKPFAGAKLYLVLPNPTLPAESAKAPPPRATTGSDGRFEFTATRAEFLPANAPTEVDVFSFLQVVAAAKGHGPDWTRPDKRPTGELTLRLRRNEETIEGRILDLQGKALAGAKVHVRRLETTAEDDLGPLLKNWRSTGDAQMALGGLTKILYDPSLAGLPRTVTTDADGRFRLPGAGRDRIVTLSVEAPLIEQATIRVLPRSAAEVKALSRPVSESMMQRGVLPPPIIYGSRFDHLGMPARIISGTVRDKETAKPISGIRVFGHPAQPYGETRVEAHTDKEGRYQLRGLPKAKKYYLFAWPEEFSPSYIPGGKEVSGGEGTAAAEANFELSRGVEVRGRVTDKATGKPVTASVSYRPLRGNRDYGSDFFRIVGGAGKGCACPGIGTFREKIPPGPVVFLVTVRTTGDDNPYLPARLDPADRDKTGLNDFTLFNVNAYRVIDVPADAKSVTCDIQVDPGRSVTGTVLGPDGKPLAGAQVRGLTEIWPNPRALKRAQFTARALDPRQPRQLLFVHVKRKLVGKQTIRGDEKEAVTVQLQPWSVLTGRVLDEDGKPVVGVRIQLGFTRSTFVFPVTWWVLPQGEVVQTDRDGRFRAEGLTPDMNFILSVSSGDKFLPFADNPDGGARQLSVRAGETKDLGDLKVKTQ